MFDRSAIFKAAWATAHRRKAVYAGSLREHFRAGLQLAWWDARTAARVARDVAAKAAHDAAAFTARSDASLRAEIDCLENAEYLGCGGAERLARIGCEMHRRGAEALPLAA